MKKYILFFLPLVFSFACTDFELDPVNDRYDENFDGKLSDPADIDPAGVNTFTFSIMGDTHVGSGSGDKLAGAAAQAVAAGDAFVVVAGDLTEEGKSGQYYDFVNILSAAGLEYRAAIGNHDILDGGWSSYKSIIGKSIYRFSADNVDIFILDSANATLGEKQLDWLEASLGASSATHKIVVSHYAPWVGSFSTIFKMASDEESAILKDMLHRHNVAYMFSGHYHGYEKITLGHTNYIVTGGVNSKQDPGESSHYIRVNVSGGSISFTKIPL